MSPFYHLLVTIFNVRSSADADIAQLEAWAKKRTKLFEQFCLPSVLAQTEKNFDWLLLIDVSTKGEIRKKIEHWSEQYDFIHFTELNDISELVSSIKTFAVNRKIDAKTIITTRLDNDDLLHEDFIKTVQLQVTNNLAKRVINLEKGYTLKTTNQPYLLFETTVPQNPFISLVEPYNQQMLTVREYIHNHWGNYVEVQNVETDHAMWIQLIHGNNVLNHVQGKPVKQPTDLTAFQLKNEVATHQTNRPHQIAIAQHFWQRVKNKLFNR